MTDNNFLKNMGVKEEERNLIFKSNIKKGSIIRIDGRKCEITSIEGPITNTSNGYYKIDVKRIEGPLAGQVATELVYVDNADSWAQSVTENLENI